MSGRAGRELPQLLDAHRERLRACRRCVETLDPAVRPVVSDARAPRAMLVGQAPGRVEMTDGRAFAGRAGKTLFRWLARAGIDEPTFRAEVHIAAVTRCYPGPSPSGRGDRVPSPAERARCAGWLEDELRMIRPALIVPVGRLAIDRFLPAEPLDRLIGRAHSVGHAGGESLAIPLPHPSGASSWIHAPGHAALLERALERLGEELRRLGIVGRAEGGAERDTGARPRIVELEDDAARGTWLDGARDAVPGPAFGPTARAPRPAPGARGGPPEIHDASDPAADHHRPDATRTGSAPAERRRSVA